MAYVTADEVRERSSSLPSAVTDADIERCVVEFKEIAERYRGVAYEPTEVTETVVRPHDGLLLLSWPKVRSITSLTADDVVLVDGTDWTLDATSAAVYYYGGYAGFSSTVVVYEHGYDEPPALLVRACVEYVQRTLSADNAGTSRDIISQTYDGGFTRYSTPDWDAGRPTGWLEVDRLLNSLEDERVPGLS